MSAWCEDFEPRPRYLEDPNFKIEVGKHYLLVSGEYVYIDNKKSLPFRKTVFYDHNKKPYNFVGCSLVPNEAFNGSIYKQVTEEEFEQSKAVQLGKDEDMVSCSRIDSKTKQPASGEPKRRDLLLKVGYAYKNGFGHTVQLVKQYGNTFVNVFEDHAFIRGGERVPTPEDARFNLCEEIGPITELPPLELKPGKRYRDGTGAVVSIVALTDDGSGITKENYVYPKNGKVAYFRSKVDLIEELPDLEIKEGSSYLTASNKITKIVKVLSGGMSISSDNITYNPDGTTIPNISGLSLICEIREGSDTVQPDVMDELNDTHKVLYTAVTGDDDRHTQETIGSHEDSTSTDTEVKLTQGSTYRRRDGSVATICERSRHQGPFNGYLFIDADGSSYDEHGLWNWPKGTNSPYDIIEEIDCTTQEEGRTTFSFKPTTPFLTTVDIINIGQYINKIEELANKVGLDVEIRLTPSTKEGM